MSLPFELCLAHNVTIAFTVHGLIFIFAASSLSDDWPVAGRHAASQVLGGDPSLLRGRKPVPIHLHLHLVCFHTSISVEARGAYIYIRQENRKQMASVLELTLS